MKSPATLDLAAASRPARSAAIFLGFAALALLASSEARRPTLPTSFELADVLASGRGILAARAIGTAWAVAALLAICAFVSRTFSPRAALYAGVVLATSPMWFVAERAVTGTIAASAASAIAFASLGIAALDAKATPAARALAAIVGAAVAAAAWLLAKDQAWVVVGTPALAIGVAALAERRALRVGAALAAVGVVLVGIAATHAVLATRAAGAATFDSPVTAFAYGLAPWSPFVPFAFATRPRNAAHLAIVVAAVTSIALASLGGAAPLGAPFVAVSVAALFASLDRTRRSATLLAVSIAALAFLVAHDLGTTPARMITSFVGSAAGAGLDADAVTKASSGVVLPMRMVVGATAAIACAALLLPRAWLPLGRGAAIVIGGSLGGLALRAAAYPSLLARLSPSAVVDAWHAHRETSGPIAPLALFGVDGRAMAANHGDAFVTEANAHEAAAWLTAPRSPADSRHFLALASSTNALARVNADYRNAFARNVPVLVADDESTWLLASALRDGETDRNPLGSVVLDATPTNVRPLGVTFDAHLHTLGWQLTGDEGDAIATIPRRSRHAHVRVLVQVDDAPPTGYCTFLHIDHTPSRFAAEHRDLPYPMDFWRSGDTIADDFDVTLPAGFRAGAYKIFWGFGRLPCADDKRMTVLSGPSDGHGRVSLGAVEVK